ncbi:hypothetical protein, partial [Lactococcus lactis]|uniref:hypothetical protein n=1 Tax=Lactococcus lactis TaxID=1358 RepID=UPI0022E7D0B0
SISKYGLRWRMLLKHKIINRVSSYQDYNPNCKCKHCRRLYKTDLKITKKNERAKIKKYIKDNMD